MQLETQNQSNTNLKFVSFDHKIDTIKRIGKVIKVLSNVIYSNGPVFCEIGEIVDIKKKNEKNLKCEVAGFDNNIYTLIPFGSTEGVSLESDVISSGKKLEFPINDTILGRIFNGIGEHIDKKTKIYSSHFIKSDNTPINPLDKPIIKEVLQTGIKAIDGLLTIGKGQRIGIFSGSGVGKSTLLGMIARYTDADINIISLIGERGREVNEFIQNDLGLEALKKSVIFISTPDAPCIEQINCAMLATSTAEYFREKGKNVNLFMDSLTRFAQSLREIASFSNESPITKGFSASVFSKLAKLVERTGKSHNGSITGFYTVLTDTDEMEDPIADAVRGYIDGHIILSRKLAEKSHYPSIDIPSSLSRLMKNLTSKEIMQKANTIRELISTYNETEDLIKLNAYIKGSEEKTDLAIEKKNIIDSFLKQNIDEYSSFEDSMKLLSNII